VIEFKLPDDHTRRNKPKLQYSIPVRQERRTEQPLKQVRRFGIPSAMSPEFVAKSKECLEGPDDFSPFASIQLEASTLSN
jgi:hypothetical protein